MHTRIVLLVIAGTVSLAPAARGQHPEARILIGGGSGTDIRGVRSTAYLAAPSLSLALAPASLVTLSGRAVGYATGESAFGAGLAFRSGHALAGPLGLDLDGAARFTHTSHDIRFLTLEGIPVLDLRLGPATLFGGVRVAGARTTIESGLPEPLLGGLPERTSSTSSFGPVFGGSARLATFAPGEGIVLHYREDRSTIESVRVIDRGAGLRLVSGPVTLGLSYGRRDAPDDQAPFGGVQLVIEATRIISLVGSVEEYPSDRLTGALGGRTVSAGMAVRFGGPRRPKSLPTPAGIGGPANGVTRLSIRASGATQVEIAGDWNHWTPEPARRAANGVWYVDLRLRPGEYRYAFRLDGSRWAVPDGAPAVDDGFGGRSAWVVVRQPGRENPIKEGV